MAVSVVIVNYNAGDAILECIESIFNQAFEAPIEVIVVDNDSSDRSVEEIILRWPHVQMIRNEQNVGFGTAANIGIKAATFEYILLANPDTRLTTNALHELYAHLSENENAWLSTCKIVNDDGSVKPSYSDVPSMLHSFVVATGITSVLRGLDWTSGLLKLPKKLQHNSISRRQARDDIIQVPASLGALMFFKKSRLAQVGCFTEDYFMYWEDVDLSLKIRKAGGKIYYNGKATVFHHGGSFDSGVSSRQAMRFMVTQYYKSERIFWKKHFTASTARRVNVLLSVGLVVRKLFHTLLPFQYKRHVPLPEKETKMKRNKNKILTIAFKYYYQDPRIQRQLKALVAAGYEVDFICPHDKHVVYPEIDKLNFIKIHVKKKRSSKIRYIFEYASFFVLTTIKCTFYDMQKKYGLIQIFVMPELLAFCVAIPRLFGAKILMDWEDPAFEVYLSKFQQKAGLLGHLLRVIERLSIKMVHKIITPNQGFLRTFVARGCPREKIKIITNSPESEIFDPDKVKNGQKKNGHFTILYSGTITKRHGLDIAFQALKLLREKSDAYQMVVVGDGEFWPNARQVAQELDVLSNVNYLGRVPLETIPKLIVESDVGIISNRNEPFTRINFPTRILEHAVMGKPVVAPKLPGILDYVNDQAVSLYEPENAQDMARAIEQLRDPQRQQQLIVNARKIYDNLTWDLMRERYLYLVRKMIEG